MSKYYIPCKNILCVSGDVNRQKIPYNLHYFIFIETINEGCNIFYDLHINFGIDYFLYRPGPFLINMYIKGKFHKTHFNILTNYFAYFNKQNFNLCPF